MIKANFIFDENVLKTIEISGHAEYDESGKDIVCAAVSTAIIVTANAIELLNLKDHISLVIEEGYFRLDVIKDDHTLKQLLKNLEYTLYDLEQQYPSYINNQKER